MKDLYELINIKGTDIEESIKDAIKKTRLELSDLTEDRTCIIYSNYLYKNLRENHIVSQIINTKDFGFSYEHEYVIVPKSKEERYVIDLTYSQFNDDYFKLLLFQGFELMNDGEYQKYIDIVATNDFLFTENGTMKVK